MISRRGFFATVAGAVVAVKVAPTSRALGVIGGAQVGAISGAERLTVRLFPDASHPSQFYEGIIDEVHAHRTSFRLERATS